MSPQWLDVDLDYFNDYKFPVQALKKLLSPLSPSIPAHVVVEHHHVLARLKKWVKEGVISIPFEIHHVDEHHDWYQWMEYWYPFNCGTYCIFIPRKFYSRFVWIGNTGSRDTEEGGWRRIATRLRKLGKTVNHVTMKQTWNPKQVKAATFCVSPDYLLPSVQWHINEMVDVITEHFNLKTTVKIRPGATGMVPRSWCRKKRIA